MFTDKELRAAIRKAQAIGITKKICRDGVRWLIRPNGKAYASRRNIIAGRERPLALGIYPDNLTLAEAREKAADAKKLRRAGGDPAAERQRAKQTQRAQALAAQIAQGTAFEVVAREWHGKQAKCWTPRTAAYVLRRLKAGLFSEIGARPIAELKAPELLFVLRKVEARGTHAMVRCLRADLGRIFGYGVAAGMCERNPAADIAGALEPPPPTRHHAALKPEELPDFLKALDGYKKIGHPSTYNGQHLLLLTAVRTAELCGARWSEIDTQAALWTIPAARMKMRVEHTVPLSAQALAVLVAQRQISGGAPDGYVFPGARDHRRPMSKNAMLGVIDALGYKGRTTGHGIRTTLSTWANESGHFRPDVIEAALAHQEPSAVRRTYNRAQLIAERRRLFQAWADFLDIQIGENVLPMRKKVFAAT